MVCFKGVVGKMCGFVKDPPGKGGQGLLAVQHKPVPYGEAGAGTRPTKEFYVGVRKGAALHNSTGTPSDP